jgi:hypothetical protein
MKKQHLAWAFCLAVLVPCAELGAQQRPSTERAKQIVSEAMNSSDIVETAEWFTDFLGARLTASNNGTRAEKLVEERMRQMGLSNARREVANVSRYVGWDNERTYVAMTSPYYDNLTALPIALSGSTDGLISGEVVYLTGTTKEDLERYHGKLAGKIVLAPSRSSYTMSFQPLAKRWTDEELANSPQGTSLIASRAPADSAAQAALRHYSTVVAFINQEAKQAATRPAAILFGRGSFNVVSSEGSMLGRSEEVPVARVNLPIEDHSRMVRLAKRGIPVHVELDVRNRFSPNDTLVRNVIAEIPGTDKKLKDEVVMIGAHLDSWQGGTGAADNASGCIVMMEAMRILKQLGVQPRRTIRIALWGGEEQGLLGSRGYASQYIYDRTNQKNLAGYDKFALYLNMDNGSGRFRGIYLQKNQAAVPYFETWGEPMKELGFTKISLSTTGSTDHVAFNGVGLSAYQFIQDPLEYGRSYHTNMDTFERLSIEDLRINAAMIAWFVLCAADDDGRIPVFKP